MTDKIEKLEKEIAQKKRLLKAEKQKVKEKECKIRRGRQREIGALLEKAIGRPVEKSEMQNLENWLLSQKDWIEKALAKKQASEVVPERTEYISSNTNQYTGHSIITNGSR